MRRFIEAYGVKGLQSKPWRKTFRSFEALQTWAAANDAEVLGSRWFEPQRQAVLA